jgi:tripartite-type tricarboxylate transporter receptor subunit TctC
MGRRGFAGERDGKGVMRKGGLVASMLAVAALATPAARAEPGDEAAASFYAGKSISLFIGSAEGGIYSQTGHVMATYLRSHIPGHPAVVAKNMPGGSSVRAAEYLYNVAPRDGTSLGYLQPSIVLHKILHPDAKYRPQEFGWLGRLASTVTFGLTWHTSSVRTIEDARRRPVIFAADGAQGGAAMTPWALNRVAGTQFKVIVGYDGGVAAQALAMERGEVEGMSSASLRFIDAKPSWHVQLLYAIATARDPRKPEVPAILELARSDEDRAAMRLLASVAEIGQSLLTTPDVPRDRLAALSDAFDRLVRDREFVAALGELDFDPLPRGRIAAIIAANSDLPAAVVARVAEITRPGE